MIVAFGAGVSMAEFWRMTPWQLGVCLEAYSKRRTVDHDYGMFYAWHTAAFYRMKKMPDLKEVLSKPKGEKMKGEAQLEAFFYAYEAKQKQMQSSSSDGQVVKEE